MLFYGIMYSVKINYFPQSRSEEKEAKTAEQDSQADSSTNSKAARTAGSTAP